jgi:hypothetical protein
VEGSSRKEVPAGSRHSSGLEQFFVSIHGQENLNILDWAGVSQANVSVITGLGHRLYSDDFLRTLDAATAGGVFSSEEAEPLMADAVMRQDLQFPPHHFDGLLIWDMLEYTAPGLLKPVIQRLYEISKPGACLLALFHGDEKNDTVPVYHYRIADEKTLLLAPRERRRPVQLFNNRALEKLFIRFQSIKFFLTRDNLREVIVRR